MLSGMLGRKVGMTQIFGASGAVIPVTIIEAGPCTVTQVKTEANDGYEAVQLGFETIKLKHTTRPMLGHLGHELKPTDRQRTHGQSDRARAPGSIGPGTTPGRVYKGTRMAGRMGNERVTVKALRVVQADAERNLLVVFGSVPGPNGGLVMIRKSAAQMAVAARQRG